MKLGTFCPWNLLLPDFCSWNLLHVGFPFRETCKKIFILVKLILLMELVVCFFRSWSLWHAGCCSWNLLHGDFSLHETFTFVLFNWSCTVLNFVSETCFGLILIVKLVASWFSLKPMLRKTSLTSIPNLSCPCSTSVRKLVRIKNQGLRQNP